ncbi:MAG: cupin domain-containing protein [Acidobacteriia bacterium]|nr:cupin domain-containing protein [Terriglobia bacterium]
MIKSSACVLCVALALYMAVTVGTTAFAADSVAPVRLDRNKIAGLGLTAVPPDAYSDILVGGKLDIHVAPLFTGKELRASIFESTPVKTDHRTRPNDTDEFVLVLSGKLILTEPNGTAHEFVPGDSLVLPVGYTGTWEMQGNYRELAVTMKKGK